MKINLRTIFCLWWISGLVIKSSVIWVFNLTISGRSLAVTAVCNGDETIIVYYLEFPQAWLKSLFFFLRRTPQLKCCNLLNATFAKNPTMTTRNESKALSQDVKTVQCHIISGTILLSEVSSACTENNKAKTSFDHYKAMFGLIMSKTIAGKNNMLALMLSKK